LKKIIQKIVSKILNSSYIRSNPYIQNDFDRRLELQRKAKIQSALDGVSIDITSKFYEETIVHNCANDKSKILIGSGTHIQGELLVQKYGGQINIGNNCYVGIGTKIWSGELVTIGNNVLISHNCDIIDSDTHEIDYIERATRSAELMKNGPLDTKGNILTKPIIINDYAWISFNVAILKGVTIGKGAIVAAGSLVTKDVPAFTVVAGNPAVIIKQLPND
jgi:acetyltransferase-like isoleucine patch superfamily enzyme